MKSININFKKLYELPLLLQIIVLSIFSIIFFVLGYFLDILPLHHRIAAEYQQQQNLHEQLMLGLKQKSKLKNEIMQLPKLKQMLSDWQKRITPIAEYPILEKDILKFAETYQLKIDSFTPGSEFKKDNYTILPIKILMTDTYHQIASFISYLANYPSMIVVNDFSIRKEALGAESNVKTFTPININRLLRGEINIDVYEK